MSDEIRKKQRYFFQIQNAMLLQSFISIDHNNILPLWRLVCESHTAICSVNITHMVIRYSLCFDVGWLRAKHAIICCRLLILMQTAYRIQYDTLLTHERHSLQATFFHLSTPNKCEIVEVVVISTRKAESTGKWIKSHTSRSLYIWAYRWIKESFRFTAASEFYALKRGNYRKGLSNSYINTSRRTAVCASDASICFLGTLASQYVCYIILHINT